LFKPKDQLYNEFKSKPDKPIEYTVEEPIISLEIGNNITGRLYPNKEDILYNKIITDHYKMKTRIESYTK